LINSSSNFLSCYAAFFFPANGLLSPDSPKLYDVILETEKDKLSDQIGFRTIEVDGTDIKSNGKSIFLRGISMHEESPIRGGRAYSIEDAETLLSSAIELGCNFVRLAHYPHNERIIKMADKMGMLVWSEIPVYWTILWDNPDTYKLASQQLSEMISRDKNRASVIIWSVANETPRGESRLKFLGGLINEAKKLDATRLISAATELKYKDKIITVDDPLSKLLDVIGANEYLGWYSYLIDEIKDFSWKTNFNKPLIISEFGAMQNLVCTAMSKQDGLRNIRMQFTANKLICLARLSFFGELVPGYFTIFIHHEDLYRKYKITKTVKD
jgi:beta-glucuronidase